MVPAVAVFLCSFLCLLFLTQASNAQKESIVKETFLERWNLRNSNGSISITDVAVPGVVHTHLQRANIIGNPLYRFNDVEYAWIVLERAWTYSTQVRLPAETQKLDRHVLIFESIDTVADIFINDQFVMHVENMFHEQLVDVSSFVRAATAGGALQVRVVIFSPVLAAQAAAQRSKYEIPTNDVPPEISHGFPHRNFIRKQQSSFSWDWGPAFPTSGLPGPVRLVSFNGLYFKQLVVSSVKLVESRVPSKRITFWDAENTFEVVCKLVLLKQAGSDPGALEVTWTTNITAPQTKTFKFDSQQIDSSIVELSFSFRVSKPLLWYPVGHGSQPLYLLRVSAAGQERTNKIGFRSLQLVQTEMGPGQKTFQFRVNGLLMFAKGANLVPLSMFSDQVSSQQIKDLLAKSVRGANMNMIRVWGGGIYMPDVFYDTCDELGLLVWQEFMFAVALYPRTTQFLQSVSEEVRFQTRRLVHHPSIAILGGNNEIEASLWGESWYYFIVNATSKPLFAIDYSKLFNMIERIVRQEAPNIPWWTSSPSNGPMDEDEGGDTIYDWLSNPQGNDRGDVHYYNYYSKCSDVSQFPTGRFISEYGWQSLPSLQAWLDQAQPQDLRANPNSQLLEHRQHHPNGYSEINNQLTQFFDIDLSRVSISFDMYVYLTQILQTICVRAQTEYYLSQARIEHKTAGALYWQLQDPWAAPTWSSLEYDGRAGWSWKLLHYAMKEIFAPIHVSALEWPGSDTLRVFVNNDGKDSISGILSIVAYSYQDATRSASVANVSIASVSGLSASQVLQTATTALLSRAGFCQRRTDCVLRLLLFSTDGKSLISENAFYPSDGFIGVNLAEPRLRFTSCEPMAATSNRLKLTLTADHVAPFVYMRTNPLARLRGRFSKNGFVAYPGESTMVDYESDATNPITCDTLRQNLEVFSLVNAIRQ